MYKLLIVDDEPQILEGMKRTLDWEKYGFSRIETSETYEGAISKAVEFLPNLAIFDVCIGKERAGITPSTDLTSCGFPPNISS